MDSSAPGFYESYASYKGYETPSVGSKQIRRFDAEIWQPAQFAATHRVLEIGCGTGAFLAYLAAKGVPDFLGIDHDPNLAAVVPANVADHFSCRDVWQLLDDPATGAFDRVVLLDVLEHFTPEDGRKLLDALRAKLAPGGRVVLKVPNASCPWGLQYQFGDLTHRTAFTPYSLHQLADSAGLRVDRVYAQRQGSKRRMITDALVHRFLSWALLTPPQFWSANLYAVLTAK